jgi:hypothetical protein
VATKFVSVLLVALKLVVVTPTETTLGILQMYQTHISLEQLIPDINTIEPVLVSVL